MRKYSLMTLLLLTAGILFYALHEYVEVSVMTQAQAQAEDPAIEGDTEVEAEDCGNGHCFPTKTSEDKNSNTNMTKSQIAARYLGDQKRGKNRSLRDGDQ